MNSYPSTDHDLSRLRTRAIGPSLEYMESFKNDKGKYQCVNCDKSYLHFKHLKRHYMKHTGNRPHVCRICQDTFCRSDILKRHYGRCLSKFQTTGKCAAVSRVPKRIIPQPYYGPLIAGALVPTDSNAPHPYYYTGIPLATPNVDTPYFSQPQPQPIQHYLQQLQTQKPQQQLNDLHQPPLHLPQIRYSPGSTTPTTRPAEGRQALPPAQQPLPTLTSTSPITSPVSNSGGGYSPTYNPQVLQSSHTRASSNYTTSYPVGSPGGYYRPANRGQGLAIYHPDQSKPSLLPPMEDSAVRYTNICPNTGPQDASQQQSVPSSSKTPGQNGPMFAGPQFGLFYHTSSGPVAAAAGAAPAGNATWSATPPNATIAKQGQHVVGVPYQPETAAETSEAAPHLPPLVATSGVPSPASTTVSSPKREDGVCAILMEGHSSEASRCLYQGQQLAQSQQSY